MSKGSNARGYLIGRLGDNIEVKELTKGKVGNLRLAVSSGWGDKVTTSWFTVVVYDQKKIEALDNYTEKGSRIFVEGELRNRSYEKDGSTRYVTEVVVGFDGVVEILDGRKDPDASSSYTRTSRPAPPVDEDLDDDVPF